MFPLGGIRGNANRTSYILTKPHLKRLNLCAKEDFLQLRMGKSRVTTSNTHKSKLPWHHGWDAHQMESPPWIRRQHDAQSIMAETASLEADC